jgi:hypothetical protein
MRYRVTFLAGFAAGYIAGARAGRERYEQIVKLARQTAGNPAVRQAADTVGATATEFAKTAKDKVTEKVPKFAETAKNKVSGSFDRIPGRRGQANSAPAYPASADMPGPPPSRPVPGSPGYPNET